MGFFHSLMCRYNELYSQSSVMMQRGRRMMPEGWLVPGGRGEVKRDDAPGGRMVSSRNKETEGGEGEEGKVGPSR
jgi:hypothetical protein